MAVYAFLLCGERAGHVIGFLAVSCPVRAQESHVPPREGKESLPVPSLIVSSNLITEPNRRFNPALRDRLFVKWGIWKSRESETFPSRAVA
ncbi:hypothetical protein EUGRSUZ_B03903 [Eucalyptus grandis]|uniref:Uncharacterized protein n=2 Tax=Eucalyptus grandis TaxID=71139 RepID=A0ACC3LYM3_EUCGR|nr:hypothetical protein EUGRSUZ_B03903 [Eucalyptus grandis]